MNLHDAFQALRDASTGVNEKEDRRGLWMKAAQDPSLVLSPVELPFAEA